MAKIIKIVLWLLAFVPLVVDNSVFYPYTTGKNLVLETCLVLAGILFATYFIYSLEFRKMVTKKAAEFVGHPVGLSVLSLVVVFVASSVFAVDKYSAFWGTLERAEGLSGFIFLFCLTIFSFLVFERRDWLWFFRLSLLTALVLLSKEFGQAISGVARPAAFVGNPIFLAGYLLLAVVFSLIVLGEDNRRFWKILAAIILPLSIGGIFMTGTRGSILGLGLGFVVTLAYFGFKGEGFYYKKFKFRKISLIVLGLVLIFLAVFGLTRKNEIWQKVPGLSRVATTSTINPDDTSTSVRLFIYKSSLQAVNPSLSGSKNFLLGWGPDNFALAEAKYYDARQYKIETDWYDRAHNKFLDILVMNGLLGLLVYLAFWACLFWSMFWRQKFSVVQVALLFFGVSTFVHLLFVFDQASTAVPFWLLTAFLMAVSSNHRVTDPKSTDSILKGGKLWPVLLTGSFLIAMALFMVFVFFANTLPGYVQMKSYLSLPRGSRSPVLHLSTTAQMNIRRDFLESVIKNPDPASAIPYIQLLAEAFAAAEEYSRLHPYDIHFIHFLGDMYSNRGNALKNNDYLKKGEEYFEQALASAPNRPDINYGLALDLVYQKRFAEARILLDRVIDEDTDSASAYYYRGLAEWLENGNNSASSFVDFEKSFSLDPGFYSENRKTAEAVYTSFVKYFYDRRDKDNFLKTAERLKQNDFSNQTTLDGIIRYLNEKGVWPVVNFK